MSAKPLRPLTNLLIILVLLVCLGPARQNFISGSRASSHETRTGQLVNALREHLTLIGLDGQEVSAQSPSVRLLGPPDGTLYERGEQVTLRWSFDRSLNAGERYVVTVAYYERNQVSVPLEPKLEQFVTTEEVLQTPVFDIDLGLPVIAWAVHVEDQSARVVGQPSEVYRLLLMLHWRPYIYQMYSWDDWF